MSMPGCKQTRRNETNMPELGVQLGRGIVPFSSRIAKVYKVLNATTNVSVSQPSKEANSTAHILDTPRIDFDHRTEPTERRVFLRIILDLPQRLTPANRHDLG